MSQATAAGKSRLVSTRWHGAEDGRALPGDGALLLASVVIGTASSERPSLHVGLQYRAMQMPIVVKQSPAIRQQQKNIA